MKHDIPKYLQGLNSVQLEAVLHEGSPLLILAGAGSGKTRVITMKIAYLIEQKGIEPQSILAVTFTNKAAREMLERVVRYVPDAEKVMIRTFHSFGAWLLRRNAHVLGMDSNFTIYDEDDSYALLKSLFPGTPRQLLSQYAFWISRAKDYCLGPSDALWSISHDPDFKAAYEAYEKKLREIGNADFGDLIMRSVELLREQMSVRERVNQRFKVVLVDEYQDSNTAQYELLKLLAGPDTYLCVVGDDDQSIYRFRGAEVKNILTFPESFPRTTIIRLEENYRSTQVILSIATSVVQNNEGRLGKTLWTRKAGGKKAMLAELEDQEAEATFCAQILKDGNLKGTAILYRTNAQSRVFETLFSSRRIPYKLVGTVRFYEREEVKDVLAVLAFLLNQKDAVAFGRIINKPSRGIGEASEQRIVQASEETKGDFLEACVSAQKILPPKAGAGARSFVALIRGLLVETEKGGTLDTLVHRAAVESGLMEYHKEQDEIAGSEKQRNIEELINAASAYPASREGLSQFLEHIELDREQTQQAVKDDNYVTLITMHNTKGLEFDRVIITGLEEGVFPRGEEDREALEEERRIFYVSITRAREELYLTYCRTRRIHGRCMVLSASRFLEEIPKEHLIFLNSGVDEPAESSGKSFNLGDAVYHEDYGSGTVVRKWYNGNQAAVMVRFETGRTCQFIPKYTPALEKICE